ncbi:MAG: hypothetical protein JW876_06125 [Candidatus Krumholzibacteriota bacterium]|nr:hypothetical protein [Candidatus Krumholzibacteriota bacterium]
MSGRQKVYVIDPVRGDAGSSRNVAKDLPAYLRSATARENRSGAPGARAERASGVPAILSCMAGPFSILATSAGRRSRAWMAIALLGAGSATATAVLWTRIPWPEIGFPAAVAMIAAAAAAAVSCCLAWTRGIVLAGREEARRMRRSPGWLRSRAAAGLIGSVFPGMGLFVSGHHARAAAALWVVCLAGIAAVTLTKAGLLWDLNAFAGPYGVDAGFLERFLIAAAAVAAAGVVAWVVQALDGIRLAGPRRNDVPRGNAVSLALVAALALMAFTFDASVVAGALDAGAAAAAGKGMREIPFQLARAAAVLDPSRPAYACRVIEMGERCGKHDYAARTRRDLLQRLEPSIALLETAGMVAGVSGAAGGEGGVTNAADDRRIGAVPSLPAELALHGAGFAGMIP